jgi:hypothetical protein
MIQPLRTVHRRVFIVLAGILPTIILAGLHARPARAPLPRHPGSSRASYTNATPLKWENNTVVATFDSQSTGSQEVRFSLLPADSAGPDLLLYWTACSDMNFELSHARLIGPVINGASYSLPRQPQPSALIVYSLAHRAIVDKATLEAIQ